MLKCSSFLDCIHTESLKHCSDLPVSKLVISSEQNEPKIAAKHQNNKFFKGDGVSHDRSYFLGCFQGKGPRVTGEYDCTRALSDRRIVH